MAPWTANVPSVLGAPLRNRDLALAGEELAGDRVRVPLDLLRGAFGDHVAAVHAGARAHVDQVVGRSHHLLVVLDHEHRVAEVAQPLERGDQLPVVALVEADRGLVEDVEHADQLRADLRREPQPLRFAAAERRGRAVELQVADADVLEKGQALADLLQDPLADQPLGLGQLEPVDELDRPLHRHARERVDVGAADGDREHLGLQPRTVTDRARPEAHVLLDPLALLARVGLLVAALEARDDALEGEHVRALAAHPVAVLDVDLVALGAEQEQVLVLVGELLPRELEVDLVTVGDRLDDRLVEARVAERPGHERALADRERRVGHEQIGVDLLLRAEPGAARAGAVRRVEAEDARLELRQAGAVLGAGEVLAEGELVAVEHVDDDQAVGQCSCGFDRLRQSLPQVLLHHQAVDDDLDRVLELLVERRRLLEQVLLAVDLHAREPFRPELLEDVLVLALAVADDRRVDGELRACGELQDLVDDRLLALTGDRAAADRAVRLTDPRVEQAQVVVDLGDGADRRARVAAGGLLVDRDRRGEPVDRVDVGFLHHLEELPGVGAQALDVAPLAFRVDRVEGKAGLA